MIFAHLRIPQSEMIFRHTVAKPPVVADLTCICTFGLLRKRQRESTVKESESSDDGADLDLDMEIDEWNHAEIQMDEGGCILGSNVSYFNRLGTAT